LAKKAEQLKNQDEKGDNMLPGMNSGQMKKMMKMMNPTELEVAELIFNMKDGSVKKMDNPSVTKMNMMGNVMYQVQGDLVDAEIKPTFTDEDVQMVAEKAGVDSDKARQTLEETQDIAEAIMKLQE